jgi:hypothetical protein
MNWKSFEEEVAVFFRIRGYQIKRNVEQAGKSGVMHEIDVLASKEGESIVCECKSGDQKPSKHLVAEWESICRDLPFEARPAIASEAGFTYMGLLYAKTYNITLIAKSRHYPYQRLTNLEFVDLTETMSPSEISESLMKKEEIPELR